MSNERKRRSVMGFDARVARVGAGQLGLVTRGQMRALGATGRMIDGRVVSGRLVRVRRSVYALPGSPDTWSRSVLAACLVAGPEAAAGGRTAAGVWELPGSATEPVEIWTPPTRRARIPGVVVRRCGDLGPRDVVSVQGVPCLSAARTLIALATIVDASTLERALDDALRRKLVRPRALLVRITELERRGTGLLEAMTRDRMRGRVTDSELETRFLQQLRRFGLPEPARQFTVRHEGRWLGRVDLAYPQARVFIELDSRGFHSTRQELDDHDTRQNRIVAAGWVPLRYTWTHVHQEPEDMCREIAAILGLPWPVRPKRKR